MISREEVAKKLREAGKGNSGWFMTIQVAFFKISDIIGTQFKSYEAFFNRLADLIDPTCTADIKREDDGIDAQPYYTSSCGNCGALWDTITGAALLPKYCPHCGARVVSDEA
jgi:hypothetical protein|nr:MAG TPA: Thaumarchaeal output domain 1 [Caudoviricetes sp.]